MVENNFNFIWLFELCRRHVLLLSLVMIVTLIVSSLVSLFCIESKFESSVLIYPTTTHSVSQALLVEHNPYRKDVLEFGEETDAEQLLQILNSDEIRDSVIQRFDLYNHYQIDKNSEFSKSKINKLYKGLIHIKKTKFNSIKILVLDKDPSIAAMIANDYLTLMDTVINRIRQNRAKQALLILEKRKELLYQERNLTQDSLQIYRLNGVISITAQTERLTEQYAIALASNNLAGAKRIKNELNQLSKYAGVHDMLLRKSYEIEEELATIEFESDRVSIDTNYTLENKFIINKAYPADKKSYPVRWLIVFSSLVVTFILTLLFLCILDYINNVRKV